jgi:hypothetical protein
VIQIVVTATSDAAAAGSLAALVEESGVVLDRLQAEQDVTPDDLMSITTVTQDESSVLQQKTRMVTSAGAALGLVIVTLLVASLVDGLSRRARRSGRQGTSTGGIASTDDVDDALDEDEQAPQFEELSAEETAVPKAEDVWALIEDPQHDRETTAAGGQVIRGRGSRGPSSRSR